MYVIYKSKEMAILFGSEDLGDGSHSDYELHVGLRDVVNGRVVDDYEDGVSSLGKNTPVVVEEKSA